MRRAGSRSSFLAQLWPPFRRLSVESMATPESATARRRIRIAVVGDVHDQWDSLQDKRALEKLEPDLVLFTGDFGDANVEIVHSVSQLEYAKAVILGNHDCWCFFAREHGHNPVELQLQSLGDCHVGYKRLDFSDLKLSVIGGRPFSSGGSTFGLANGIITQRFNVRGMQHSAEKISSLALGAPTEHVLVFLGHNGPTGLGSNRADICGKDFHPQTSGDYGDPDLEAALKTVKEQGQHNVQLVIFGHMHKSLAFNRGNRTMLVKGEDNILYVNAAVVPRVMRVNVGESKSNNSELETVRNFTVIDLICGVVEKVAETWVRVGEVVEIEQETILHFVDPQQE